VFVLLDGSPEAAELLVGSLSSDIRCHVYSANIGIFELEQEIQLLSPSLILIPTYKQIYFKSLLSKFFDISLIKNYIAVRLDDVIGDFFNGIQFNLVARTSGSTGNPKYLAFSLDTKVVRFMNFQTVYEINKHESVLISSSFHQTLAIRNLLNAMHGGFKTLLCWPFNPEIICSIDTQSQVFLTLVPAQIKRLLISDKLHKFENIRLLSSSSYLNVHEKKMILSCFSGNFYECYGTAEVAICTSIKHRLESYNLLKSVGYVVPGCEIKLIESKVTNSAELITVKSNQVVNYIFDRNLNLLPVSPSEYLNTGDLGIMQQDDSLVLLGRDNEIIDVGGSKIYPIEIENLASKIPGVISCLAFPIPHQVFGEVAGLAVVSNSKLETGDIINFFIDKVESYKVPRQVFFVDEIPMTTAGKPDRSSLLRYCLNDSKN